MENINEVLWYISWPVLVYASLKFTIYNLKKSSNL